jgi:hypothetical protein
MRSCSRSPEPRRGCKRSLRDGAQGDRAYVATGGLHTFVRTQQRHRGRTKSVNPYGAVGFLEVDQNDFAKSWRPRWAILPEENRAISQSNRIPLALLCKLMIFLAMISVARQISRYALPKEPIVPAPLETSILPFKELNSRWEVTAMGLLEDMLKALDRVEDMEAIARHAAAHFRTGKASSRIRGKDRR